MRFWDTWVLLICSNFAAEKGDCRGESFAISLFVDNHECSTKGGAGGSLVAFVVQSSFLRASLHMRHYTHPLAVWGIAVDVAIVAHAWFQHDAPHCSVNPARCPCSAPLPVRDLSENPR